MGSPVLPKEDAALHTCCPCNLKRCSKSVHACRARRAGEEKMLLDPFKPVQPEAEARLMDIMTGVWAGGARARWLHGDRTRLCLQGAHAFRQLPPLL